MARRLQNNVSESRMTLPAAAIYATLVWMAGGLVSDGLWMQFGCFAASTYLMVELNNANALIRVYSRMVSCAFIALSCAATFLFTSAGGAAMELFAIASYAALFRSYQDRQAAGLTFYAFMSISTGSLFYAEMLYFAPVLWLLMAAFVRSASLRTVAASVLGLCLPYWLAAAIALYTGHLPMLADHLGQLAATGPLCDFSLLSANQVATMAFVMAMAATGIIHYRRQSINDKIRTRMFYSCFITMDIASAALAILQPQHYELALRMMIVNTSPLIAHFITLTNTKVTNVAFCAIVVAILALTAFNLWMPSTNF